MNGPVPTIWRPALRSMRGRQPSHCSFVAAELRIHAPLRDDIAPPLAEREQDWSSHTLILQLTE
jgi:hypothetical protein